MAAERAGRIGWDIGSTVDIASGEYTQMMLELFENGEPTYVDMLDKLCSEDEDDDEDEDEHPLNRMIAMIRE